MRLIKKLSKLHPSKESRWYIYSSWLSNENADILAEQIKDILNSLFMEGCLLSTWKEANIIPLPKLEIVKNMEKPIEIINNTRGGIVMFIQSKKGNADIGGQI